MGIYNPPTSGGGGGGTVTSVSNSDGSITVTNGTAAAVVSLNPAHSNHFTALQSFDRLASYSYPTPTFLTANTAFVSTTGNDGTAVKGNPALPFLTPVAALAVCVNNDAMSLGEGQFDLGNNILDLSAGGTITVHMIGQGAGLTTITSTASLTVKGCIIKPGNNSYTGLFTIYGINVNSPSFPFQGPWGRYKNGGTVNQTTFTGAIADRLVIKGFSDGFYVRDTAGSPTGASYNAYGCIVAAHYDTANTYIQNGDVINYFNCAFIAQGPASFSTNRAVSLNTGGTANCYNCSITAAGGSATSHAVEAIQAAGAGTPVINLYNCHTSSGAASGSSIADIYVGLNSTVNYFNTTGSGILGVLNIVTANSGIANALSTGPTNYQGNITAEVTNGTNINAGMLYAYGATILGGTATLGYANIDTAVINHLVFSGALTASSFVTTHGDTFGGGNLNLVTGNIYLNSGSGSGGGAIVGDQGSIVDFNGITMNYPIPVFQQENTLYVSPTGNDSTGTKGDPNLPFLTLTAAVAAGSDGDLVSFAGVFDLGSGVLDLSGSGVLGLHLIGDGSNTSQILSAAILTTDGCIIKPGNGSVTGGFNIGLTGADSDLQAPWGMYHASGGTPAQTAFVDVVAFDLVCGGYSDGIFIKDETKTNNGAKCSFNVFNCGFYSTYNTGQIYLAPGYQVSIYGSQFNPAGPSNAPGGSSNVAVALSAPAYGTINVYNTGLIAYGSDSHNYGAYTASTDATINVFNGNFFTAIGSGGGDAYDIKGNVNYSNCSGSDPVISGGLVIAPGSTTIELNYKATNIFPGNLVVLGTMNAGTINSATLNADVVNVGGISIRDTFVNFDGVTVNMNDGSGSGGGIANFDEMSIYGSAQASGMYGGSWNLGDGSGAFGGVLNFEGGNTYGSAGGSGQPGGTYYLGDGSGSHGGVISGDNGTIVDIQSVTLASGVILGFSTGNLSLYMNGGNISEVSSLTWGPSSQSQLNSDGSISLTNGANINNVGNVNFSGSNGSIDWTFGSGQTASIGFVYPAPSAPYPTFYDGTTTHQLAYAGGGGVTSIGISSSTLTLGGGNPVTSSGVISVDLPSGYTGTITTAPLTALGSQGSMTYANGLLTSQTQAT